MIDTVLFVYSEQPIIDRGWDPKDAKLELSRLGLHVEDLFVTEIRELLSYFESGKQNILVWPVCYTIGEKVDGPLLVEALRQLNVPFMGASSDSLKLNSKITLKERLKGSVFQSPEYQIINSDDADAVDFPFPYLMKCEYSCDSKGVSIVRDEVEHSNSYNSLTASFDQRVFAEQWERNREFTVAYIPNNVRPIIAPLEMIITSGDLFVDSNVKSHNEYLRFELPRKDTCHRLIEYVSDFANCFSIDGYFRVDLLSNDGEVLHIIDMNLLPQMHASTQSLSYFPMCFQMNYGFSFQQVVCAMVEAVRNKGGTNFVSTVEDRIASIEYPKPWQR